VLYIIYHQRFVCCVHVMMKSAINARKTRRVVAWAEMRRLHTYYSVGAGCVGQP
jgi:hypothetical protein